MEGNYSLADIATASGGGFGESWIIIILFLLVFGNGAWGGRGDYGQFATSASQQEILFGQQFQNIDNKMDRGFTSIGNGIADATFSLNNSVKDGFFGVQKNTDSLRFDMANYANAINSNIDNKFAQFEKTQLQAQISQLTRDNQNLYLAQQMCGVVRYPNGMTYNAGTSPFCNCGNSCCM